MEAKVVATDEWYGKGYETMIANWRVVIASDLKIFSYRWFVVLPGTDKLVYAIAGGYELVGFGLAQADEETGLDKLVVATLDQVPELARAVCAFVDAHLNEVTIVQERAERWSSVSWRKHWAQMTSAEREDYASQNPFFDQERQPAGDGDPYADYHEEDLVRRAY